MYSQEAIKQGWLYKKQKILRIGAQLKIGDIKRVIVNMYLAGMSCQEIAEDFNNRIIGITITAKGISDQIGKMENIDGEKYIRNKVDSFNLAIKNGRKTYKIKENKYKRVGLSLGTRYKILERDKFKCVLCGGRETLEVDHKLPISQGGNNDEDNLQTLCYYCNHGKAQFEK